MTVPDAVILGNTGTTLYGLLRKPRNSSAVITNQSIIGIS
jgi:hypothetical protein